MFKTFSILASLCIVLTIWACSSTKATNDLSNSNRQIDYQGFVQLAKEVGPYRENRKISIEQFNDFAKDPSTIILDTRSAHAFQESHLKGAINFNFSDFTEEKLAKVIPSKETRILIYCNNNFDYLSLYLEASNFEEQEELNLKYHQPLESLTSKLPPLALNIPTFINLYGYGYKNIYELNDILRTDYTQLIVNRSGN